MREEHRAHIGQGAEFRCRASEPGCAVHQHVHPGGHVERERYPLLDEQHGGAAFCQPGDDLGEHAPRHRGRQVRGRLVKHQGGGLCHQGTRDRQQLALAAAERLGEPLAQAGERGEAVEDLRGPIGDHLLRQPVPAHLQVFRHRQGAEHVPGLRHVTEPARRSQVLGQP
jgi:hypothetical protein